MLEDLCPAPRRGRQLLRTAGRPHRSYKRGRGRYDYIHSYSIPYTINQVSYWHILAASFSKVEMKELRTCRYLIHKWAMATLLAGCIWRVRAS